MCVLCCQGYYTLDCKESYVHGIFIFVIQNESSNGISWIPLWHTGMSHHINCIARKRITSCPSYRYVHYVASYNWIIN